MTIPTPFSMFKEESDLQDMQKTISVPDGKKDLVILPDGKYGFFKVRWDDNRSPMPESLRGNFTTYKKAEIAIAAYLRIGKTGNNTTELSKRRKHEYKMFQEAKAKEEEEKTKALVAKIEKSAEPEN